jgi:hypothetical protein
VGQYSHPRLQLFRHPSEHFHPNLSHHFRCNRVFSLSQLPPPTLKDLMTDTAPLIFYSQSSVGTDWDCARKRYLSGEYGGTGLTINETSLPLFIGEVLHAGLAGIAHGLDIDELASTAITQIKDTLLAAEYVTPEEETYASEQAALVEGLLRGFHRHVWPRLRADYEIVSVEGERIFRHNEEGKADPNGRFVFMAKPDLIVRDKEGCLWYVEYKSTSSNKEAWTNSWASAIQLHSGVRAVEQSLGEAVTGVIVQGLYKGYVASGKSTSPFCYAYFKAGDPPFTKDRWSYAYVAGYKKYPVWEREGGVKRWVEEMPEAVLAEQFPQVPPIFVNDEMVDAFFRQRALREGAIADAGIALREGAEDGGDLERMILDHAFQQNFSKCSPSFGYGCSFQRICHGPKQDPLSMGYQLRDTSHREKFKELVK